MSGGSRQSGILLLVLKYKCCCQYYVRRIPTVRDPPVSPELYQYSYQYYMYVWRIRTPALALHLHSPQNDFRYEKDVGMGLLECLYNMFCLHTAIPTPRCRGFRHSHPYIPLHFWKMFFILVHVHFRVTLQ